jgi:hypothetical protein
MSTYISVARFRVIPEDGDFGVPGLAFLQKKFSPCYRSQKPSKIADFFGWNRDERALLSPCYFPVISTVIRMTVAHLHFVVDPASPAKQRPSFPAAGPRESARKSLHQSAPSKTRSRQPRNMAEEE